MIMKDNKCSDCTNDKGCVNCEDGNMHEVKKKEPEGALKELLDNIDPIEYEKIRREMLKEAACEDLDNAAWYYIKRKYGFERSRVFENECIADDFKAGANWQKVQIMKDAVECKVHIDAGGYPYINGIELYDYDKDVPLAKKGDKVKVIIINEE